MTPNAQSAIPALYAVSSLSYLTQPDNASRNTQNQSMSAELNAISNLISGVKKSTGKGQSSLNKLSRTAGKTSKRINDKKTAEAKAKARAAASEEKRKGKENKTSTSKPTSSGTTNKSAPKGKTPKVGDVREALGSKKISIEEASKLNPKGTSTPLSKKPSDTFTPKSKTKKATQPALPGMSKSKVIQS